MADEQSGMVLSDEACEEGKKCKDAECIKSHVSPAAVLGTFIPSHLYLVVSCSQLLMASRGYGWTLSITVQIPQLHKSSLRIPTRRCQRKPDPTTRIDCCQASKGSPRCQSCLSFCFFSSSSCCFQFRQRRWGLRGSHDFKWIDGWRIGGQGRWGKGMSVR